MRDESLKTALRELSKGQSTLLWLEGARSDVVLAVRLAEGRLVLRLASGATRVVSYERVVATRVGLQFWAQGRPGVLFRWDQVPRADARQSGPRPLGSDGLSASESADGGDGVAHEELKESGAEIRE